ncbi:putative surface layer protein [Moritella sp. PE36]|nr:putative surface layer protein [Moritella sp. PE36]
MKIQSLILFFLLSVQIFTLGLSTIALAAEPSAFSSWAKTAKLGGAAVWSGMTQGEIDLLLSNLQAQKVSVIEADSSLSNYLTDAQFELQLSLMRTFVNSAHKRGLRVVWYYPSLEVVTVNGKNISQTMAKEHPDWIQIGMNGTPNVFYGGGGQVFWVEKDDESAWMSPSAPGYRNYFLDRVRKIVATGIDGLWVDVPIYADFGPTKWSGFNTHAVAKFLADTGFTAPAVENWDDPVWRRWITWRHEELARFLSDVTTAARSQDPEFPIFAETLPTDYNGATIYGLDGSYLKHIEGLTHVWEVDTMSNTVGMRNAQEDDWISFISAFKYTRAASGEKPSWVFNYGKQVDDAGLVMAAALATGNNPYELQVPEMTTTVGAAFRTRMFDWAQKYSPYLFEAQTGARVAVLYSSPSRDYVDKYQGLGMFTTWESGGDPLWWAGDAIESAYQRQYLAEYRGMVKMLVHEHIPFDSVVNPADVEELSRYDVVILPNVEAISNSEAAILRQYVTNGGNLLVTGPNPTGLDRYGTSRSDYALAELLGFNNNEPLPAEHEMLHPNGGKVSFFSALLGKAYFVSNNSSALQILSSRILASSTLLLTTNADRRVHFELSHLGDETVLQFVNFIGVDGSFSLVPTTFSTSLNIPAGKQVTGVALTSPDQPALSPIAYTVSNQKVTFNVSLSQYALVVVSFDGAQTPVFNNTPIAGQDDFNTNINTALVITDTMLLSNDGDLDGDPLTITTVNSTNTNGSFTNQGGGNYTYTPLLDFVGTDTLSYAISDGKGGVDSAVININIAPSSTIYYPEAVVVTTGSYDWGTMASFNSVDNDTYDIISAAVSGGRETDWYATVTISEQPENVAQIKVTHIGQYSKAGVEQHLYVYNFQAASWELVDTTIFGIDDDVPVSRVISAAIENYISAQGQLRVRIKGAKNTNGLQSWSNVLYWEVTQSPGETLPPTNTPPMAQFTSTCTNLNCNFTDTSTDTDGSVTAWSWDFGDSSSSTQQSPIHTFSANGLYTVNLTVSDNDGSTNSVMHSVTVSTAPPVNQVPTATFTSACTNLNCNFIDTSTDTDGTITAWNWSFGDSSGSTQPGPSHTFSAGGTFTVSLTVTDNDGSTSSVSHSVTVSAAPPLNQAPSAAFTSACTNLSCELTDTSTDTDGTITTWNWNFGDGSSSAQQNPNHSYATEGSYTASLTVTDNDGATNNVTHTVTINSQSAPSTKVYYPNAVNITTGSYDWGTVASFLAPDSDTYDIDSALVSSNQTIDWYVTTTIPENPENITQIKMTNIGQYSLAGVSQNVYVYNFTDSVWELVDTSIVGNEEDLTVSWIIGTNIPHYISAQGQLRVRITGANNAGSFYSWSNSLYWEVTQSVGGETPPTNTPPTAAFTSACSNLNCDLTDTSIDTDGNVTAWSWDFGDGSSSALQHPNHTYATEGTYTVNLTVTDDDGSTNSVSHSVTVSTAPPVNQTPTAAFTSACTNLNCELIDISTDNDGSITAWNWDFGDGSSSTLQNPNHSYATAGTYTVSLVATDNDGSTSSVSHSVTVSAAPPVNQAPTAAFTSACTNLNCDLTDISTDTDGSITAWNWDFGDGESSIQQYPAHTFTSSGTYTLSLTVTDNNGATSTVSNSVTVSTVPLENQAPTAAFTSACTGFSCNYTDASTDNDGNITAWSWNFGDGSSSTLQNPNHTYATEGAYTVSLTVTDDDTATSNVSHTVTINIQSAPSTKLYYPDVANIITGSYDWGTMASFLAPDSDTYDIYSTAVSGNQTIDWYVTTTITELPENITQIKVINTGQYSLAGVSQSFYIYNFQDSAWELVDTSIVDNEDDVTVSWIIGTNIPHYISTQGQLRIRITGTKNTSNFYSWLNALYWEVTHLPQ